MCTNNASVIVDFASNKVTLLTSKDGTGSHSTVRSDNGLTKSSGRSWRQYEVFINDTPAFDSSVAKVQATAKNLTLKLDDTLAGFEDTLTFSQYAKFLSAVATEINSVRANGFGRNSAAAKANAREIQDIQDILATLSSRMAALVGN